MSKKINCCICGKLIKDNQSNNPRPVKFEGRCCHKCDTTKVHKLREERAALGLNMRDEINHPYKWSEERSASHIAKVIREGGDDKLYKFIDE